MLITITKAVLNDSNLCFGNSSFWHFYQTSVITKFFVVTWPHRRAEFIIVTWLQ